MRWSQIQNVVRDEWISFEITARPQMFCVRRLLVVRKSADHPKVVRSRRRFSGPTLYPFEAGIFGVCFSNLSFICRNNLRVDRDVFQTVLYDTLMPVARNFSHMAGADVKHLERGLATHRVIGKQYGALPEAILSPAIQRADGHGACAFGATAAILVLFRVAALEKRNLAPDGALDDGDGLGAELERMLEYTIRALAQWSIRDVLDAPALGAEVRALKRA